MFRKPGSFFVILFLLPSVFAPAAHAHALSLAQADARFASNGEFCVKLDFDVVAFMAGVEPSRLRDTDVQALAAEPLEKFGATLAAARERMQKEFGVLTQDGTEISAKEIALPADAEVMRAIRESIAQKMQPSNFVGELRGALPDSAREVRLQFPAVMGAVAVKIAGAGKPPFDALHLPGETGPPYELGNITPQPARSRVLSRYLLLGFTHIVPGGTDHILFVLALFLLCMKWRPLLWQITAFTLAHSITLGFAMYGVFQLPAKIVEPCIALSIACVAIENVFSSRLHAWRPAVVFAFGLIHGLGFARVLLQLGLPRNEFGPALVAFNVGVEFGQLSVIATAAPVLYLLSRKPRYRTFITVPASVLIALFGLIWAGRLIF